MIRTITLQNCPVFWVRSISDAKAQIQKLFDDPQWGNGKQLNLRRQALIVIARDGRTAMDTPRPGLHVGALEVFEDLHLGTILWEGDHASVSCGYEEPLLSKTSEDLIDHSVDLEVYAKLAHNMCKEHEVWVAARDGVAMFTNIPYGERPEEEKDHYRKMARIFLDIPDEEPPC